MIVGAGPAGLEAAQIIAKDGKRVAGFRSFARGSDGRQDLPWRLSDIIFVYSTPIKRRKKMATKVK